MRNFIIFFYFIVSANLLWGQPAVPSNSSPDTLIQEHFEFDPEPFMSLLPTGSNSEWVNFDEDKKTAFGGLPGRWYWERDLADPDTINGNDCFTSSSPTIGFFRTKNWLILPPVFIPDQSFWLYWRSQPLEGPGFMDGYSVLLSTQSNSPASGHFTDLLFKAAETIKLPTTPSLNPNDFTFSSGYVHADRFTKSEYFYVEEGPFGPFYRCKFEPHRISLAKYAGKMVYIAFLHDAFEDNILQLDDIVVANASTTSVPYLSNIQAFNLVNNQDGLYINWALAQPEEPVLWIAGSDGRILLQKKFERGETELWYFDHRSIPPGIYYCTLQTQHGRLTKKWIK